MLVIRLLNILELLLLVSTMIFFNHILYFISVIDCGQPKNISGTSNPKFTSGTEYGSTFVYICSTNFVRYGSSSLNNAVVTCQNDSTWDLGSLMCKGRLGLTYLKWGKASKICFLVWIILGDYASFVWTHWMK